MSVRIVVVTGPTGAGKSALARRVAERTGAEIVVADSRQVFRGMDVGTAKPSPAERQGRAYHGIDLVEPGEAFDAAQFQRHADLVIARAADRGIPVVVEGGTGLYLRALVRGLVDLPARDDAFRASLAQRAASEGWPALHAELARVDPTYAARIAATDPVRITRALEVHRATGKPFSELGDAHAFAENRYEVLGGLVDLPKDVHARALRTRVQKMWDSGLLAETERLLMLLGHEHPLVGTINYAQAAAHLRHGLSARAAMDDMVLRTTQFAKRQRTWFRKEPWAVPVDDVERFVDAAARFLGRP